jgi:hypothetical protein
MITPFTGVQADMNPNKKTPAKKTQIVFLMPSLSDDCYAVE